MDLRFRLAAGFMGVALAAPAQLPSPPGSPAAPWPVQAADPFAVPPEAMVFIQRATLSCDTDHARMQELLRAMFRAREAGGMGLRYDNARTRSVAEVWREGKANCLSMTAFFVMACRAVKVRCAFAEALNTNHWRKVGTLVRYERHVVALAPSGPSSDLVADFAPELRKRIGVYVVATVPEERFRALFYSNQAVEALGAGAPEPALALAQRALASDAKASVGWNILGVVQAALGHQADAEGSFRRAMTLDPMDGAPLGNLESLLRELGRLDEASTCRQLEATVRKKDPFFHAFLAEDALAAGDLAEAETRIHTALGLLATETEFHLLLARVKLAEGDLDGASKGIEAAKRFAEPLDRARFDGKLAYIEGLRSGKTQMDAETNK